MAGAHCTLPSDWVDSDKGESISGADRYFPAILLYYPSYCFINEISTFYKVFKGAILMSIHDDIKGNVSIIVIS